MNLPLLHFIEIISYLGKWFSTSVPREFEMKGHLPEWENTEAEELHWMKYENCTNGRIKISLRK